MVNTRYSCAKCNSMQFEIVQELKSKEITLICASCKAEEFMGKKKKDKKVHKDAIA